MATPRRSRRIATLIAWAVFLGGLLVIAGVDRSLRSRYEGGLGDSLAGALVVSLAAVATALAWRASAGRSPAVRVTLVGVQVAAGFVVYAFAALAYVCGAGIDCM